MPIFQLGTRQEENWAGYLRPLEEMGYERREPEPGEKRIMLLYFS